MKPAADDKKAADSTSKVTVQKKVKKPDTGSKPKAEKTMSLFKDKNGEAQFSELLAILPEEIGFQGTMEDLANTVVGFIKESKGRNRDFQILLLDAFGEENGNKLFDAVSGKLRQMRALVNK